MMNSDKLKDTRTLVILNSGDAAGTCSDSVTLSDNVLKRINELGSGKPQESVDSEYLKEEDKYWKNRMACLEEEHKRIQGKHKEAFDQAIGSYTKDYANLMDVDACKSMTEKIIECYKNNPGETLKCSQLAEQFTSCINSAGVDSLKKL